MPDSPPTSCPWPALLSDKLLGSYLSLSRRSVWRAVATGELPKPLKLGGKSLWRREDVDAQIKRLKVG